MSKPPKLGLVLSAGGARAAYQVGVLRFLAENCPEFNPRILAGVSAGSINAAFLAQGLPPLEAAQKLYAIWENIDFDQVFKTNFKTFASMGLRWLSDLFVSKVTRKLLLKSLLDATPLSQTLLSNIHFWKISKAVRNHLIDGIALCATNYHNGNTTIFFDSAHELIPWERERRVAIRCAIRVRHVLASCSIPVIFEPVRIGNLLYGDGSLRFSFPFSPAVHLGATHVIGIGIRCPNPENPFRGQNPDHLSLGFVAGSVLDSIFLDSLEFDYENLCRINNVVGPNSEKYIHAHLVKPSMDLGAMARDFLKEVPFHFRQVLRSTADPSEMGDLLSYLMFSRGYIKALLELGMKDAAAQLPAIKKVLPTVTL